MKKVKVLSTMVLSVVIALCFALVCFAQGFDATINFDGKDLTVTGDVDANGNVTIESVTADGEDLTDEYKDNAELAEQLLAAGIYDVNAARAEAFGIGGTEEAAEGESAGGEGESAGGEGGSGSAAAEPVVYDNYVEETVEYDTYTFDGSTYGSETGLLTVTINGVEVNPADIEGIVDNVVFTVTESIPAFVDGYASDYRTALYYDENGLNEASSVTSAVISGSYDNEGAEDLVIMSANKNFEGIIATAGDITIDGLTMLAEGNGGNDFAGLGAGVAVGGTANVTINNYKFLAHGVIRHGVFVGGDDEENEPVLTVNGGYIVAGNPVDEEGNTVYTNESGMSMYASPWMLGIEATPEVRTQLMASHGTTNYNDVVLISSGWGIVSSDAVDGPSNWGDYTIKMNLNNCILDFTGTSGYVSYAIGATHNSFTNCVIGNAISQGLVDDVIADAAEYNYDITYEAGVEFDENCDVYNTTYALIVANETSGGTFDGTTYTGQYGVMWHKTNNVSYVPGATDNSAEEYPADGYTEVIDSEFYTNGAAFLVKACTPVIYVENSKFESKTGVIVQLATCDDPGMGNQYFSEVLDTSAPVEADPDYDPYDYNTKNQSIFGFQIQNMINDVQVSFKDCVGETALNGNFYNSISVSTTGEGMTWFGQNLILSFDNCEINGDATSSTALHNNYSGFYDADGNEVEAATVEEALEKGAVEGRITSENATYLGGMSNYASETVNNGVWVVMTNSTWTPEGTCYLTVLDFDEASTINGVITVDGEVVTEAGRYTGKIVVAPEGAAVEEAEEAPAEDAAAAEAGDDAGDTPAGFDASMNEGLDAAAYPHFDEYRDYVAELAMADSFMSGQEGIPDDIYAAASPYIAPFADINSVIGAADYADWMAENYAGEEFPAE